jgi:alkyl hydroperoxide reductase subunit AhpF
MGTVGAVGDAPAPSTGMGISATVGALCESGLSGRMGTVGEDSFRAAGVSFCGLPDGSAFGPREVGLSCPMRGVPSSATVGGLLLES